MRYRWTVKCVDRETAQPETREFVAESKGQVLEQAAAAGLLIESIVQQSPIEGPANHEAGEGGRAAAVAPQRVLPHTPLLAVGWSVLALSMFGVMISGSALITEEPGSEAARNVPLLLGASVFGVQVGVFTVVICSAADSVCICLREMRGRQRSSAEG